MRPDPDEGSFFDFDFKDIDGNPMDVKGACKQ